MPSLLHRYARWLHTCWPAGCVEPLPVVGPGGRTRVPGLYVCGDLAGVPLLKFALDTGARAAREVASRRDAGGGAAGGGLDVAIVGAGVSGMAAALEAKRLGLSVRVLEASEAFSTVANFPRGKPIFTYPEGFTPAGGLQVRADRKEPLLDELRAQAEAAGLQVTAARAESVAREPDGLVVRLERGEPVRARAVIVAVSRSGDFRKLGVPGETLDKVFNRLHDPADFRGRDVLVVGGGDAALEAAIALGECGARTTLVHRGASFARPKPENVERAQALERRGALAVRLNAEVREIRERDVELVSGGASEALPNDAVFTMLGREAPIAFLRRCGLRLKGEPSIAGWAATAALVLAVALVTDWKSAAFLERALWSHFPFPSDSPAAVAALGAWWRAQVADRATLAGTIAASMLGRSFYYTVLYTAIVGVFGLQRVRRRATPYVARQTLTLFLVQAIPLFLLPEIVLPWLGYRGAFDHGAGRAVADALFERTIPAADYAAHHWPAWGHPRAYWRAYGFILAWPLNVYEVFTAQPLWAWIGIGFVQTFVLLPLAIRRWGKGAYCGWICSCGALAETLGDTQRGKMPHGPGWNRLNLLGQVFLAFAFGLLALRIAAWALPGSWPGALFQFLFEGRDAQQRIVNPLGYKWLVDVLFGSVIGVGFYFKYSGRVWCRFACPLAALMHVYARFSRFAIVPEKKKCISCNVCTSVCHQGIDVMAFANRGLPMQDPQCVRCSACVEGCPTGVLRFGEVDRAGQLVRLDALLATRPAPAGGSR